MRTFLTGCLLSVALLTVALAKSDADVTVHITKTGHCYHRAGCSSLRKSDFTVTLAEAKDRGLTPCKNCNPPS